MFITGKSKDGSDAKEELERGITITHVGKPKQETLEEAAEREYPTIHEQYQYDAFIEGAKWQQERSYSEEDMVDYSNYRLLIKKALDPKEWFKKCKR